MKQPDKSDGLLAKHTLLIRVIETEWATKLDHKVMAVLVDRYMSSFRNSRASLRFLEKATKSTRSNIITSLRRLADQRVIWVIREGQGTRPTEFGLNFDFPRGIVGDTSTSGIAGETSTNSSGIVGDTSRGTAGDTSKSASGIVGSTESLLHNPLTSGVTVKEKSATASALGLAAAPVGADFVFEDNSSTIYRMRVTSIDVGEDEEEQERFIYVEFQEEGGAFTTEDSFTTQSPIQKRQDGGQRELGEFLRAIGKDLPGEGHQLSELNGCAFMMKGRSYPRVYIPADDWGRRAMGIAA